MTEGLREDVADVPAREEDGRRQPHDHDQQHEDQRRPGPQRPEPDLKEPVAIEGCLPAGLFLRGARSRCSSILSHRQGGVDPCRPFGEAVLVERLGQHLDGVAGRGRQPRSGRRARRRDRRSARASGRRIRRAVFERTAHAHVVDHARGAARTRTARARPRADKRERRTWAASNRIASASFTPPSAARVDLAEVDRLRLQQLFEDRPGSRRARPSRHRRARSRARMPRGRARRRGSSAPRSTAGRTARACSIARSPRRRPTPGWRPSSGCGPGPISLAHQLAAADVGPRCRGRP